MDFERKQQHYRGDFPILNNITWLNHAAHGPWSISSLKAMDEYARTYVYGPMVPSDEWEMERERSRELMAQFLSAKKEEIGFNFNTSLSLTMFTHSIKWEPEDNIIVPDRCFPSIVMPAKLLQQRGVEARLVDCVDGLICEEKLIGSIDQRTRMMIIPMVNFLTGQRLDVKQISQACRDAGVFLVVDAIQAAGPVKIDVKSLNCHALCFGSPKWMFGPMGIGTVYVNLDDLLGMMLPQMGMYSVHDPWNFFNYDQELVNDSRRFECGCADLLAHYGFNPNLRMLLDLGLENIENHILWLTGFLHDELTSAGVDVITPREDSRRAGIVTFNAKSAGWDDPKDLFARLDEESISVSLRMGLVRVSPHFYNSKEEIEKLLYIVLRKK